MLNTAEAVMLSRQYTKFLFFHPLFKVLILCCLVLTSCTRQLEQYIQFATPRGNVEEETTEKTTETGVSDDKQGVSDEKQDENHMQILAHADQSQSDAPGLIPQKATTGFVNYRSLPSIEEVKVTPQQIVNAHSFTLTELLGKPILKRKDGQAEIWLYQSDQCYLNVFLYRKSESVLEVEFIESRPVIPDQEIEHALCVKQIGAIHWAETQRQAGG
ncbi:MAG: hypothetical protein AAF403_03100 [Pseudomonadota bacterium]